MQRDAGARGITCQKIGEAEVMVEAGLDDIPISYNILGEQKLGTSRRAAVEGEGHGCTTIRWWSQAFRRPQPSRARSRCRGRV